MSSQAINEAAEVQKGHFDRMFSDFMRLQGSYPHDDFKARIRWRDRYIVVLTVIPVILYFLFGEKPVAMVQWGGTAQAWTLPIISIGTVYLVHRYIPKNMAATALMTWLLYAGAFVITAFVLVSEYRKYFMG